MIRVLMDGKEIKVDELRFVVDVEPVNGVLDVSNLQFCVTYEGVIVDLVEATNCSGDAGCEVTRTFSSTFEEIIEDLLK